MCKYAILSFMKTTQPKKTIYTSNYRCDVTFYTAFKALIQQAIEYRWQILLSIKKKIRATYQQDTFGLFWSIIMPIIPMTVYIMLAQIKVLKTVDNMPFVYYIGTGMLLWLLMAKSIHAMLKTIRSEKSILTTTNFPILK